MIYGTVIDTKTGEKRDVFPPWRMCGLAMVDGSRAKCAYWESTFELFAWACDECGFNWEECEWVNGLTGEVMDCWELLDEDEAA